MKLSPNIIYEKIKLASSLFIVKSLSLKSISIRK